MTRRTLLATAGGAAAMAAAQEPPKGAFFELRYFYMRNSKSNMVQRTTGFVSGGYAPAARRAGVGPVGVFSASIAPEADGVFRTMDNAFGYGKQHDPEQWWTKHSPSGRRG